MRQGMAVALVAGIAINGCASATLPGACSADFGEGVCLDMSQAGPLLEHRTLIEVEVQRTLDAVRPVMGVNDLRVSLLADAASVIPEVGVGGFNPSATEVRIYLDPAWPDFEANLRAEFLPMLAHEIHHAIRRRSVGYGSTLVEAVVSEGLADHFSLEVSSADDPPWSTALTGDALRDWTAEVLSRTGGSYDHGAWFLGGDASIPRWTGYAVGYDLVRAYLGENPGRRASELVGEPAASFVPALPASGARR